MINLDEYEEKLQKLERLIQLREHGYKINDKELDNYFDENSSEIEEMLKERLQDEDKTAIYECEILGIALP